MKLAALLVVVALVAACPAARPCARDDQCEDGQFCNLSGATVGACQEREGRIGEGEGEGAPGEGEGAPGEGEGAPGEGEGSPGEGEGEGGGVPALATTIGVGVGFGCAIDSNQHVQCWGLNSDGQLGRNNTATQEGNPAEVVPGLTNVTHLAVGQSHACASGTFAGNTTVVCWGDNTEGNLGDVTAPQAAGTLVVPVINANILADVDLIGADGTNNGDITCVHGGGELWCFGEAMPGYLPNHIAIRLSSLDGATSLFVSVRGVCGEVAGQIVCDALDGATQALLGCSDGVVCPALDGAEEVSLGDSNSCFAISGALTCGGDDTYGVVTPDTPANNALPMSGVSGVVVSRVATMTEGICALDESSNPRKPICWGRAFEFSTGRAPTDANLQQDCGDGVSLCQQPLAVPMPAAFASLGFIDVAALDSIAGGCALTATGRVACWGDLLVPSSQDGEASSEIPLAP